MTSLQKLDSELLKKIDFLSKVPYKVNKIEKPSGYRVEGDYYTNGKNKIPIWDTLSYEERVANYPLLSITPDTIENVKNRLSFMKDSENYYGKLDLINEYVRLLDWANTHYYNSSFDKLDQATLDIAIKEKHFVDKLFKETEKYFRNSDYYTHYPTSFNPKTDDEEAEAVCSEVPGYFFNRASKKCEFDVGKYKLSNMYRETKLAYGQEEADKQIPAEINAYGTAPFCDGIVNVKFS